MASSRLGNNPLLNSEPTFDVEAERQRLGVDAAKIGRKRNENTGELHCCERDVCLCQCVVGESGAAV